MLTLTYNNGDLCKTAQTKRTAIITFICGSSAGDGVPVFLFEDTDCNYIFEWTSAVACPNADSTLSASSIFGIV